MGWASGVTLYSEVVTILMKEELSHDQRKRMHLKLIPAFENADWDTQDECQGVDMAFDQALRELHPDWEWGD